MSGDRPAHVLPDLDALFRDVEKEFGEQTPTSAYDQVTTERTSDATPAGSGLVGDLLRGSTAPYLHAAAVLHTFDPARLQPVRPEGVSRAPSAAWTPDHPASRLLDCSTMVIGPAQPVGESDQERARASVRWRLRDDVRRLALEELLAEKRVEVALGANSQMADASDPVQRVLGKVISGSLPPLAELRVEELTALNRVVPWVEGLDLPAPLPAAVDRNRQIQREGLLYSFRRLVGHSEDGRFVEHFRGREAELRKLREYVDVAKSESFLEGAGRGIARVASSFLNLHARPPLVIHGPGGVGKSTLIAKFLLQHAEAQAGDQFPFVYIDFDHPDLVAVDARSLLAEAARQLAAQYPDAEHSLLDLHKRLQNEMARGQNAVSTAHHVSSFAGIHGQFMERDRPFLFVLDTFEEVQQRSRDYVYAVLQFLDQLQGAIPRLRAVIAGRAPVTDEDVPGLDADNYLLKDLDKEAAVGFLQSRGITDTKVANEVATLVGGQPLALKLAADFVKEHGVGEVRDAVGGTGVVARLRRGWTKIDVPARLYERLLQHIVDTDVRKLAHPGLVLRRITPEIIRDVMAEPCDVTVADLAAARDLFERLRREVSLVAPDGPDVLRHRRDVRSMMLPLILEDQPERAKRLQEAAVKFYSGSAELPGRVEEVYHRLMLGQVRRVAEVWQDDLEPYLSSSLDELPRRSQAFLAVRTGAERSDEVWQAADLPDWERYAERRARDLLRLEAPAEAVKVLGQRSARSTRSRLLGIEALVLNAQGRVADAHAAAHRAIETYAPTSANPDLTAELRAMLEGSRGGELS
jgi:hypothetical protein